MEKDRKETEHSESTYYIWIQGLWYWILRKVILIWLIGFDFYKTGNDVYYFPKEKAKESLHYLWNNSSYSTDGKVLEKAYKGHGGDYVVEIINDLIKKSYKDITWVQ